MKRYQWMAALVVSMLIIGISNYFMIPGAMIPGFGIPGVRIPYSSTNKCGSVVLPADYDKLFHKADMCPLIEESVRGSPFQYLPEYRNPCWMSTVGNSTRTVLRCLPLVFLAGFNKCGTTDLHAHIIKHPRILPSKYKEPQFWSYARYNPRIKHPSTIEKYIRMYDREAEMIRKDNQSITIDASATTMYYMHNWWTFPGNENMTEPKYTLAMTIHALVPKAKILIIMRDPVDKTYSRYRQFHRIGKPLCSPQLFHQHVVNFLVEMKSCLKHQTLRACAYNNTHFNTWQTPTVEEPSLIVRASLYYVYVKDWLSVFPREQFYFVHAEDYYKTRSHTLRDVYSFLELDPDIISPKQYKKMDQKDAINAATSEPMLNMTRSILKDFFRPYNRLLAELLHDQRFAWENIK